MNREQAVARYRDIRHRLPQALFPAHSRHAEHLEALQDEFDAFVLDGFGVLNVGADPIPGARERVVRLKQAGKLVRVLTNGASFPSIRTTAKYRRWQMPFDEHEVVSSRDAFEHWLHTLASDEAPVEPADKTLRDALSGQWGFAGLSDSEIEAMHPNARLLRDDDRTYDAMDAFVLLGSGEWSESRQARLANSLHRRRRPVLVGNPDLVAPHAAGFSLEPGLFAHALADAGLAEPRFFGKPFANAFEAAARSLHDEGQSSIDPARIAMVGDTLHTDILGAAAVGWRTVLVTDHGLLRGLDIEAEIEAAGIRPDFIVPTT